MRDDFAEPLYGLIAEFETPGDLMAAAEKVRDAGFRWWDCHTPFPVHGLDKSMGIKRTILPVLVFGAGATGTLAAFLLQSFTNSVGWTIWAGVWVTGYPFLISGKPAMSLPAFIPVMFELTILFSALATVSLMFLFSGRGYWQELIESIVWAHNKLRVAPAIQPRALSITQGRAVGVAHYLLGGIATTWAFFLARIVAVG